MITTLIILFFIGYLAIALEHPIRIDKSATALLLGMLLWIVYALGAEYIVPNVEPEHLAAYLQSHPRLSDASPHMQALSYILDVKIVEALGDITWYAQEYGSDYASYDTPANAEGEQYALFAQQGVTCDSDGSGALVRTLDGTPCSWFLRTCVPYQASWAEDAFFYDVMDSGHPGGMARPSEELGVVCGFCV